MYDDVCFLPASVRKRKRLLPRCHVDFLPSQGTYRSPIVWCSFVRRFRPGFTLHGSVARYPRPHKVKPVKVTKTYTGWWFQIFFIFTPYLGKIPILTNTFEPKGCWNLVFKRWLSQTPIVITMKIQSVGLLPWLENIWQLATCNFFITQFVKDFIAPCIIFDTTNILIVNSTTTYYQVDYEILNRWIVNREFYCTVGCCTTWKWTND